MYASTENGHSLWREIIESTKNIYKSHFGHFQAISILFLFPITFSLIVYPSFHLAIFHPDYHFVVSSFEIIILVLYALFLSLFFICGVGTTLYSAVQVFYYRPINVVSSIKSLRNSFFPLLSTFILSQTIFISINLLFALILAFLTRILKFDSNHSLYLVIFSLIVLVPILIWLQVNWSLSYVITVVESKKGYETIRRSMKLVKGKRWVAFGILMYYVPVIVFMVVCCAMLLEKGEQWRSFRGILLPLLCSVMGYILMNQYIVVNVVLYMQCKELNGEKFSSEIVAGEYVSLPFEEDEKNHIVV
ncbi:uncharacterized protein LOC129874819 [Solanum dulcamara]|uniref:uncharacterized protein LOC129874819 n=1 Tax=Solanum dulcamara TaxID=45834 RepID=UPI0024851157|nr:uncharacterized protein LOC129874819 [Solanum dulcamara]